MSSTMKRTALELVVVEYASIAELQAAIRSMGGRLASAAGGYYRARPGTQPDEIHVRAIYGEHDHEGMRALGHELWHAMGGEHNGVA